MGDVCVRVAVRIRPLLAKEVLQQHEVCVRVVPNSAQVVLGSDRLFSFDHAFGPTASQDEVYQSGVLPLVESLLDGYNATVFCYGQTGSGKTYTLGGVDQEEGGIIERVAQDMFLLLERRKSSDGADATVRVSYMELYREELRDLLELQTVQKELHIREDERGNTVVVGVREIVITSAEELLSVLEMGNALRHTGVTGMNEHSSRSHAVLTLQVNICCHNNKNPSLKSIRTSKLCLVDLAGSERAGKTGNAGSRLKESAHINTGLLALGNVIRALSDQSRNRHGNRCSNAHIPYRDAKITRLLRDSLGGNTHTLMVACVSPSHLVVTETLNVLQFATKARCIRNCPGAAFAQTEATSLPNNWNPTDTRLEELEYEVKTLRELLKEKEKDIEIEREKTDSRGEEGGTITRSSQIRVSEPDQKMNQKTAWQYCLLAQEASALLEDISGPSPSCFFKQRLRDWQDRLTAVSHSHLKNDKQYSEECRDQAQSLMLGKLREELHKCQDDLRVKELMLQDKDAEVQRKHKEVEKLLEEKRSQLLDLAAEKGRSQIQAEQLVNQQILIDRLRSALMTFHGTISGATVEASTSGYFYKRPHSVPLIRNSCVHRTSRKIHSSPPTYSLERVMAAFRMRGHLLLAEIEEKEEVCCLCTNQQAASKETSQEEENGSMRETKFRRSLNRTWTSRQGKLPLKEESATPGQTAYGSVALERSPQPTGTIKPPPNQSLMKKGVRTSITERRIHELTVNMRLKEQLIKDLDRTDKETRAVDGLGYDSNDGGQVNVLAPLSMQSQQVRAEAYRSLQHMRLQRAQLRRQLKETGDSMEKNGEQSENHLEKSDRMLSDRSWLDEEEEHVLQRRVKLQQLQEEFRRREEVLLHREACLQQKNKLEVKKLQSSQALSRDLVRVSMQLESVEERLQSSSGVEKAEGVTREELEEERDLLKMKRDTLDAQLRDNRVLTAEEEHSLLQLEEAIEALDAALDFKNQSIEDKKQRLLDGDSFLHQSQSTEPAQHCDIYRKVKKLSPPEALKLLVKYFNKVVCLREAERQLRLRCDELELHAREQEMTLREMEATIQRLSLDADRRITQQHRDHQNNIQLLLQKLREGVSGEPQQALQDRLQYLEKELFFYKSTSRQLKKKLKEVLGDALHPENHSSHTQEHRQMHNRQIHVSVNKSQALSEEMKKTACIATSYTKIYPEQADARAHRDSSVDRVLQRSKINEHNQTFTQSLLRSSRGQSEESLEVTPVRLSRREPTQISPAEMQVFGSASRGQQSVVDCSTVSMMEDSIEVQKY
ncbi:kinesin-like protein KIF27 isoform X2 [Nothobranchius furzeri]|uniref:Kinesin family member 27 n=2 Tax=Nothobranchius furzeri TaxID=105023 RepID=A0A1A8B332_NOTFU|nr:transcript variant X2 [Nothobranchius furzeri]